MPGPVTDVMLLQTPIAVQAQHYRTGPVHFAQASSSAGPWVRSGVSGTREAMAASAECLGSLDSCAAEHELRGRGESITPSMPIPEGGQKDKRQGSGRLRWPIGMVPRGGSSALSGGNGKAGSSQKSNGIFQTAKHLPLEGGAAAAASQNQGNGSQQHQCSRQEARRLQDSDGLQDGGCRSQVSEIRAGQCNETPVPQHQVLRRSPRQLPTCVVGRLLPRFFYPEQGVRDCHSVRARPDDCDSELKRRRSNVEAILEEEPPLKRRRHENRLKNCSSPQQTDDGVPSQSRKQRHTSSGARVDKAKKSVSKAPKVKVNKLHQLSISAYMFRTADSEKAPTSTPAASSGTVTPASAAKVQVSTPFGT